MAGPYTVAKGEVGVNDKVMPASTVDVVNFSRVLDRTEILTDGTAAVWVTTDGSTPAAGANNSIKIPAASYPVIRSLRVKARGNTVIKFWSAGTPTYSCIEDQG